MESDASVAVVEKFIGLCIFFSNQKGFGFLSWQKDGVQQKDMFIHFSDIAMNGYKTLKKDQKVSFELGVNNYGQPKAINVQIIVE